jgi:hypothetical protein
MIDDTQRAKNKSQRDYVIFQMLAGGACELDVVEIIKKLLTADHEDFTEEEIWKEVEISHSLLLQDGKRGVRQIRSEVEQWIESNKSNIDVTGLLQVLLRDCYSDLGLKNPNEKSLCRMAFKRLVEKGVLEQVPNRPGAYRSVNNCLEKLDFMNADTTPFPVKFPLGVHEYVTIYKKSLIVLAGEPNAGKTAFLLNTAWKNIDQVPRYFSSEMGAAELQIRLKKFPHPLSVWEKIKFYTKSSDFPKVIDPNGLNIIDYLEVAKDFYEIGGLLTDIFNALDKGIAIVAIQKPQGRDVGVGGARTLDKARLYMAIEPGVLKIIKGKIWRNETVNPNGMWVKWTLGGGANFKIMPDPDGGDDWRKP